MTNDNDLRALPAEWRAYANAERSTKDGARRAADAYDACANELEAAFDAALAAAPAGGEVEITDDMVNRAAQAQADYEVAHWKKKCTPEEFRERMRGAARAALTAALHTPTERKP